MSSTTTVSPAKTEATRRGIFIYAIGIVAFITALASLAFAAKDFFTEFAAANNDIKAMSYVLLAELGIDVVFAALEIITGFSLIKAWRSGAILEVHKTIAKLIQVVVYESFLTVLAVEMFAYFMPTEDSAKAKLGIVYIAVYFVYWIVMAPMSTMIKKNELMKLSCLMMVSSFIAIAFVVWDGIDTVSTSDFLGFGFAIANAVLTLLVFIFATATVVYYAKNPRELRHEIEAIEDADLIRSTETHDYLRVYSHRATETGMNVFINVIYFLALAVGMTATVFFALEQGATRFLGGDLFELIDKIRAEIMGSSINGMYDLILLLVVVLLYPLLYVSAFSGIIRRDARGKICLVSIVNVGSIIMTVANIALIAKVLLGVWATQGKNLLELSPLEWVFFGIYLLYTVLGKIRKNKSKDTFDGINNGDTFFSHVPTVKRTITLESIFSAAGLIVMFIIGITNEVVYTSYPLYLASVLLVLLGIHLEAKHPFSEYVKVKRRKLSPEEQAAEDAAREAAAALEAISYAECDDEGEEYATIDAAPTRYDVDDDLPPEAPTADDVE